MEFERGLRLAKYGVGFIFVGACLATKIILGHFGSSPTLYTRCGHCLIVFDVSLTLIDRGHRVLVIGPHGAPV